MEVKKKNHSNIGIIQIHFLWTNHFRPQIMELMLPVFKKRGYHLLVFVFQNHKYVFLNLWFHSSFCSYLARQEAKWFVLVIIKKEFSCEAEKAGLRSSASVPALEPRLHFYLVLASLQKQRCLWHDMCPHCFKSWLVKEDDLKKVAGFGHVLWARTGQEPGD